MEFKESREHGVGAEAAHCKQMGNLDSAFFAPICPHREFTNPPSRELEKELKQIWWAGLGSVSYLVVIRVYSWLYRDHSWQT